MVMVSALVSAELFRENRISFLSQVHRVCELRFFPNLQFITGPICRRSVNCSLRSQEYFSGVGAGWGPGWGPWGPGGQYKLG